MKSREHLIALAVKHQGDWNEIYKALVDKEDLSDEEIESYLKHINSKVLTMLDDDYPDYLKRIIYRPPIVLFYYGDISLIQDPKKNIAVVGSRDASSIGIKNTTNIVSELAKEYVIVSGMARGIDSIAHLSAIEAKGKTIAVLGNGVEYAYPSDNEELYKIIKENHLVISEYPLFVSPDREHFPLRNRIIAAISCATFVPEAKINSGTQTTVNCAVDLGQEVFCIPSNEIETSLTNVLIQEGASLVREANDIFESLQKQ